MSFDIDVVGTPGPQGSKKAIPTTRLNKATGAREFTGKVNMVESSKKVKPWRQAVIDAIRKQGNAELLQEPVSVTVTFYLQRPKRHYRTGKFAHLLKTGAPPFPDVKPDLDKLVRSTLDALKIAKVYGDDAQVVDKHAFKRYADHTRQPGARIRVTTMAALTPWSEN